MFRLDFFVRVTFSFLFTSVSKVEHFTGSSTGKTEIRVRDVNSGTSCTTNSLCDFGQLLISWRQFSFIYKIRELVTTRESSQSFLALAFHVERCQIY